jgi:hypothetical protein
MVEHLMLRADADRGFVLWQMLDRAEPGEQGEGVLPLEVMGDRVGKELGQGLPVGF